MKNQTCCFTGHRELTQAEQARLIPQLEHTLRELIHQGYRYFGTGGARGFDTLAAQTVLTLRKEYPHIRLILVLPCITQTQGWKSDETQLYHNILVAADKVVYISPEYTSDCMFQRNQHLADHSSVWYLLSDKAHRRNCLHSPLCEIERINNHSFAILINILKW